MTLCHPKMQQHTKFGISSSNNIEKNAPNKIILKTRSEVEVTVTQKWYTTLGHPKHLHTKFGIPTSKNIEVMPILKTRSEVKVTVTGKWNRTIRHSKMHLHSKFRIPSSNNKKICSRYNYSKIEVRGQV